MKLNQIETLLAGGKLSVYAETITIEDLFQKQASLNSQAKALQQEIDEKQDGIATDEQIKILDAWSAEFDRIQADIVRRSRIQQQQATLNGSAGRIAPVENVNESESSTVAVAIADGVQPKSIAPAAVKNEFKNMNTQTYMNGSYGYHNVGQFALDVAKASMRGGQIPSRLRYYNAPSETANETTPADGGYAVPPEFRKEIMTKVLQEASLIEYCDQQTSSTNSITFPIDETTSWQATGGIRVNWTSEGGKIAESKPSLGEQTIKLEKLAALLPITEELMEDAPAVARYITSKVPQILGYTLNDAIINGTGSGQPFGILGSSALVTVQKDAGQTADTITFANIVSMWASMYAAGHNKAVWIATPAVTKALLQMTFPSTVSTVPVYLPPNGLSEKPYATLLGRPILLTEACKPVGDLGDILLCDLSQYMLVQKTIGMRADVSMHLYFDYDVMTYRFILRVGGAPWWKTPIVGADGTTQYSAFVALAERA